jgi:starch phosphorylase
MTPPLGYRVNTINTLRLWKAEAVESFDFQSFNVGDYYGAVDEQSHLRKHQQGALPQR